MCSREAFAQCPTSGHRFLCLQVIKQKVRKKVLSENLTGASAHDLKANYNDALTSDKGSTNRLLMSATAFMDLRPTIQHHATAAD